MKRSSNRPPARKPAGPPGSVRIIAGKWRRRRLSVEGQQGVRPTPDRVRETLFSWLTTLIPGSRCLDMFAGSGALGFEAASRGAKVVTLIEKDAMLAAALQRHCQTLEADEVSVVNADALRWLESCVDAYDVIFVDPPFGKYDLEVLCGRILEAGILAPRGMVYLETGDNLKMLNFPPGLEIYRNQRAGQVRYYLASHRAADT